MTKLSDTQLVILSAAAQRDDHNVLPLPGSLRGGGEPRPPKGRVGPSSGRSKGANAKVVGALLKRGLIAETTTDSRTKADAALNRIWRNDEEGNAILLHITNAGLAAIGVEPGGGDNAPPGADEAPSAEPPQDAPAEPDPAPKARTPRTGTKQETLIAMLRAEGGATIDEMAAATGWAAHSIRGVLSGTLKKKLGLAVTSEKVAGGARRYRLPAV
jgi:hypothetical protein